MSSPRDGNGLGTYPQPDPQQKFHMLPIRLFVDTRLKYIYRYFKFHRYPWIPV